MSTLRVSRPRRIFYAAALVLSPSLATAPTPPAHPSVAAFRVSAISNIHPTVEVHARYDDRLRCLVLEFLVGNLPDAGNGIMAFAVGNMRRPGAARSPAQWRARYGALGNDSCVFWACLDTLTEPPAGVSKFSLYPSPFLIAPGDTLRKFAIFTRYPPRVIRYWAWGYDTIPPPGSTDPMRFENAWTGQVGLWDIPSTVGVRQMDVPRLVELRNPAPNPAYGKTSLAYALPRAAEVRFEVFDVRGARVRLLADGRREAGLHVVVWDGYETSGAACRPGRYYARLTVDGRVIGSSAITILR